VLVRKGKGFDINEKKPILEEKKEFLASLLREKRKRISLPMLGKRKEFYFLHLLWPSHSFYEKETIARSFGKKSASTTTSLPRGKEKKRESCRTACATRSKKEKRLHIGS